MSKSRFRVPHTLILLYGMILLAFLVTFLLPQGAFQRADDGQGHTQVVPNSYQAIEEPVTLPWYTVLTAVPEGFEAAAAIIFFIFIIGGAVGVFRATGAADAAIGASLDHLGSRPALFIGGTMVVFALGSSTIGMAEEYLPFVSLLVALSVALGYDAMTAIGALCVGYGVGYGAALINPFTVFIAQDIAGVQQGSALGFRTALLVVFLAIGFHHVWRYARRVREAPETSLVADVEQDPHLTDQQHPKLTGAHMLVLGLGVAAVLLLLYGLKFQGWYLVEMGGLFLGLAIVMGLCGRLGWDRTAKEFCSGATEMTTTALLIGFARTIEVVLEKGQVVDTIIHGISQPLQQLGPTLAAVGMFLFQSVCNLFIPSGSGQAYVTMPLMAPLGDLVGVDRQIAVLAYQFGDGFTNILVPTNAVLVGILAMARIPYDRWVRFIMPFMLKIWVAGSIALAIAVWIGVS